MSALSQAFTAAAAHYARMAQSKGCYAYARQRVHELDADQSGVFRGLRAEVAKRLEGFVVPEDERGEWWLMPSEAQRERMGRRTR